MIPRKPYNKSIEHTKANDDKIELSVCQSCIAKFAKENKRKPTDHEKRSLQQAKRGCECERCYTESLCEFAGIKPAESYQTMTQAVWHILRGFQ